MTQPPRAVLWDMDGTLLDSAEHHWRAWHETLAREGYDLSRASFDATFGWRNDAILRELLGPGHDPGDLARVAEAKEARYRELVRQGGIELLPGVGRWLARLRAAGWRQAVASSAPRLNLEALLGALDVADPFQAVVSAEEVERGKPDPQLFLAAAARLGAPPARCVVVEDAPAGTEAARRAGMRCVGVLSTHPGLEADVVVRTLEELPDEAFDRLVS